MPSIGQKERMWHPHIEAMPRGELRELQDHRLRAQLAYVYERSSLYREKMKASGVEPGDIKSVEDLPKLPLMAKDELRQSQDCSPPFGRHVCASRMRWYGFRVLAALLGFPFCCHGLKVI